MREMKFRAWSFDDKDWMQPSTIEVWDDTGILKAFYGGNYVIEQWSGFKDLNGKDIYEGDIIERMPYNHLFGKTTIIFEYGSFVESKYRYGLAFIAGPGYEKGTLNNFRIIGNIHENPELLDTTPNKD